LGARKSVKEGHRETNLFTEPHDTAQSFSFYRIASLHARACQPVKLRTANCVKRRQPVIIARQAGQTKSAVKVITDNQTVKEKVPQHYIRVKPQSAVLIYQSEMSNLNSEKSNN
jgi:hypothetical protein